VAQCIHHPQYQAIEHCEHCHVPLCGLCLWYVETGERLCERCAKAWQEVGHVVYPPEEFAEGIRTTLAQPSAVKPRQVGMYSGNNVDLAGLVAACLGGMILLYCVPCLNAVGPLLALIIGFIALMDAKRAVDPQRTRILAGVGIASGGLFLALGVMWFAFTFLLPVLMLIIEGVASGP